MKFSNFTKILSHEHLGLYSISHHIPVLSHAPLQWSTTPTPFEASDSTLCTVVIEETKFWLSVAAFKSQFNLPWHNALCPALQWLHYSYHHQSYTLWLWALCVQWNLQTVDTMGRTLVHYREIVPFSEVDLQATPLILSSSILYSSEGSNFVVFTDDRLTTKIKPVNKPDCIVHKYNGWVQTSARVYENKIHKIRSTIYGTVWPINIFCTKIN